MLCPELWAWGLAAVGSINGSGQLIPGTSNNLEQYDHHTSTDEEHNYVAIILPQEGYSYTYALLTHYPGRVSGICLLANIQSRADSMKLLIMRKF